MFWFCFLIDDLDKLAVFWIFKILYYIISFTIKICILCFTQTNPSLSPNFTTTNITTWPIPLLVTRVWTRPTTMYLKINILVCCRRLQELINGVVEYMYLRLFIEDQAFTKLKLFIFVWWTNCIKKIAKSQIKSYIS